MIMSSWFGDMTRAIDMYCERTGTAWDAEPLNAVSNAAFFIAAWAAWRLHERHPSAEFGGAIWALCIIIAVVGAGSLTFHTIATRWAEWADVIPILVFMLVYCWLILTAFFRWPWWLKTLAAFLLFASTFYLESDEFEKVLWGGAMYLPTLVFLMAAGAGIWRQNVSAGKAFYAAAGLFVLSFTARTLDRPMCDALPIGTHYFWLLFNAAVLFLLVRTIIVHAPVPEEEVSSSWGDEPTVLGAPGH
jgi:hypothetical protein